MFEVSVLRKKYNKKIEEIFKFDNMIDVVKCISKFEKVKECTIFATVDDVEFLIQTSDYMTGEIKKHNWKPVAIDGELLDEKSKNCVPKIKNMKVKDIVDILSNSYIIVRRENSTSFENYNDPRYQDFIHCDEFKRLNKELINNLDVVKLEVTEHSEPHNYEPYNLIYKVLEIIVSY